MATIVLYANKANQMPGLVQDIRKSVLDYKAELSSLRNKLLNIDQSTCNMDDIVSSIQAATRVQEEKIASLEALQQNSERFIEDAARIDGEVADVIRRRKDDFYEQYSYLKPKSEKNNWEKFCDGCKKVGEWCKEHWKAIVTAVVVVIAVVALVAITVVTAGAALGPILTIVVGVCKGIITGAIIGGLMGGLSSIANGGSFLEGLENGAFSGALMGAFFGGLGGLGQVLGHSSKVMGFLGPAAKAIPVISKTSIRIALGMFGFDLLSLGISLFSPDDQLVQLNRKLHSSKAYNAFQFTVTALAAFSSGFMKGRADKARDIAKLVKANNGTPPKGYKGGRVYKNIPSKKAQKLPGGVNYKEYDVNPYIKGQNRGYERIVIGDDGSVWHTYDHYKTFTQIE